MASHSYLIASLQTGSWHMTGFIYHYCLSIIPAVEEVGVACQPPLGVSSFCSAAFDAGSVVPGVTWPTWEPPWLITLAGPFWCWASEGRKPVRAMMLTRSTSACTQVIQAHSNSSPAAADLMTAIGLPRRCDTSLLASL
jgi:hypothetical protein